MIALPPQIDGELGRAYLEIRERLVANERVHQDLMKDVDGLKGLVFLLLILILVSLFLQVVWMIIKVVLDVRYERRFKALMDVVAGHGAETDRSKRLTMTAGREITAAGIGVTRMAQEAVVRADVASDKAQQASEKVEETQKKLADEIHSVRLEVGRLIKHLCPGGLPDSGGIVGS